jgi:hypothetical protein
MAVGNAQRKQSVPRTKKRSGALDKVASAVVLERRKTDASQEIDRDLALSAGMADLPAELLKELSFGRADPLEAQIVAVLRGLGGTATLDQILVGLFRKFKIIQKRRFVQNKIWRMIRKGRVCTIKGTRGLFGLSSPANEKKRQPRK